MSQTPSYSISTYGAIIITQAFIEKFLEITFNFFPRKSDFEIGLVDIEIPEQTNLADTLKYCKFVKISP